MGQQLSLVVGIGASLVVRGARRAVRPVAYGLVSGAAWFTVYAVAANGLHDAWTAALVAALAGGIGYWQGWADRDERP